MVETHQRGVLARQHYLSEKKNVFLEKELDKTVLRFLLMNELINENLLHIIIISPHISPLIPAVFLCCLTLQRRFY